MSLSLPAETAEFLRGRTVLCGFSGGSDSLCLLLALNECSAPFHFQLYAVHFNHGLRGAESDADEAWCREKCSRLSIPFRSIALDVPGARKAGESGETAARRLRLAGWKRLTEEIPGAVVALGHHADDRTENLLLRLFRGSNVSGLTSMRSRWLVDGVTFVRPLLSFTRAELEAELRERGESWRTDSTNNNACCGRNFLRLELIPSLAERFPFAPGGMRRSIAALEQDADYLEQEARAVYGSGNVKTPSDWAALHPALRCRALRCFLEEHRGGIIPDAALLERFAGAVASPPENGECIRIPVSGGGEILVERERVLFRTEAAFLPELWDLRERTECRFGEFLLTADRTETAGLPQPDSRTVFFSAELPRVLEVSARRDGDRMVPFGRHHSVPLKKLYSEVGIRSYERDSVPVLRTLEGTVLWIPGVRRSAFFPVPSGGGSVWRIRAERVIPERS